MVRLNVNDVSFSFGSKRILEDVSLSIGNGEIVGIIGQNGSGKTTLLNCINSEYRPGRGCVLIEEFDIGKLDKNAEDRTPTDVRDLSDTERARIMATVEQNSNLSFPFTVLETVQMGRYSHTDIANENSDSEMEIIFNALKDTGMTDFIDRPIDELSGGEWRRVMIAQALVQEPEILLLDEPTLHLDINHQFGLMDLLRTIVEKKNILVVIVTHDLPLAARYCDKIIIMSEGRVVDLGTVSETITEENIQNVFHMRSLVEKRDEIDGLSVFLIGKK